MMLCLCIVDVVRWIPYAFFLVLLVVVITGILTYRYVMLNEQTHVCVTLSFPVTLQSGFVS